MWNQKRWMLAALGTLAVWGLGAEDLTLDQAVARALDRGPDSALAAAALASARASDAQAQAKAGLTATTGLTYQATKNINDPSKSLKIPPSTSTGLSASLASPPDDVVPQQASGTLTLALPTTTLAWTGTGTFQVNPDGQVLATASVGATLTQTLLTGYWGGAVQAAADKSALAYQGAGLTAQANRNKAALGVKTAFFTLLAAQDRVEISAQALGQRQEALKFTRSKAQSGTASAYDLRVAQAAVQGAQLDLTGYRNALATAQKRLSNLLGSGESGTPPRALPADLPAPAAAPEEAVETALRNRSELQTAALSVRSAGIDAALAAGAAVPTVVLTGGVTFTRTDSLTTAGLADPTALAGTLGVRITPPAVDGGSADNQTLQARTQQAIFQTQLDQLRRTIPVDVQDAWAAWDLGGQRLELARVQVENADINRQIVKTQFDAGTKTVSDWLNAEAAFSNAQLTVVTARLTYQQSAATLQNLMGQ